MRELYFEAMRWAIEHYFGWDRLQQEETFSTWFKPGEARIITADGTDAGWIQQRQEEAAGFSRVQSTLHQRCREEASVPLLSGTSSPLPGFGPRQ